MCARVGQVQHIVNFAVVIALLVILWRKLLLALEPFIQLNLLLFGRHYCMPVDENLLQNCDALLEGILHPIGLPLGRHAENRPRLRQGLWLCAHCSRDRWQISRGLLYRCHCIVWILSLLCHQYYSLFDVLVWHGWVHISRNARQLHLRCCGWIYLKLERLKWRSRRQGLHLWRRNLILDDLLLLHQEFDPLSIYFR